MRGFDIVHPVSLPEALAQFAGGDPDVRPLAGGTAVMLMLKAGFLRPRRLVSLRRVAGLSGISRSPGTAGEEGAAGRDGQGDGALRIGAQTTLRALERDALLADRLPVLRALMPGLANVRVRYVATVGGNLAHADPHLDLPPVWLALDAEAELSGPKGARRLPVAGFLRGYYETALAPGELVTALHVPLRPGWRCAYRKVSTRAAHDWPALGVTVALRCAGGRVAAARVVLSAAVDCPVRLAGAEAALRGAPLDPETVARAAQAAAAEAHIAGDERGSADYKTHLLQVVLGRMLTAMAEG